MSSKLSRDILRIDEEAEVARICACLRDILRTKLRKRGLVIAISGGVDSAVCAALAANAVGRERVFGLLLPEKDSSPESLIRGRLLAQQLGLEYAVEDMASALEAIGCYRWRDEAIRAVFPDFTSEWKSKIAIAGGLKGGINYFKLVVQAPGSDPMEKRLEIKQYLQIVAATSYKQRLRKTIEYFHADRLNYAVVGTPNRVEYDQGFFVKNGDGSADVKPIAHLYKSQVYALARWFKLPEEICGAMPTTDTYSMVQGQDEFYFALPYQQMDVALWAHNHGVEAAEVAAYLGINREQAQYAYDDIDAKRKTTYHLHAKPFLVEPVSELGDF